MPRPQNSRLPGQCVAGGHWAKGRERGEVREGKGRTSGALVGHAGLGLYWE